MKINSYIAHTPFAILSYLRLTENYLNLKTILHAQRLEPKPLARLYNADMIHNRPKLITDLNPKSVDRSNFVTKRMNDKNRSI